MTGAEKARLVAGARAFGVSLDEPACARFATYLALLQRWNPRIKLTTVVDAAGVIERHFLDSLAVAPVLAQAETLVDVGSGAGFPGIPLAVARPALAVTVVESIQKKCAFLEALRRVLRLDNLRVLAGRLEEAVPADRTFDVAVSRATWAPNEWVRAGERLVAPGGRLVAMVVPGPDQTVVQLAPSWRERWQSARLEAPYAPGRALLVLQKERVPRGTGKGTE